MIIIDRSSGRLESTLPKTIEFSGQGEVGGGSGKETLEKCDDLFRFPCGSVCWRSEPDSAKMTCLERFWYGCRVPVGWAPPTVN